MHATLRLALMLIGTALGTTAIAQTAPLRPTIQTARPSAIALDATVRFPSRMPSILQSQVRAPVRAWKINPAALKMSPQIVANQIAAGINQKFAGKSVGYSVTVMMPGGATAEANGGMARRDPDPAPRGWTGNDRISVASVSKTITAATLIKLAAKRNVSLDSAAWKLLPPTWTYVPSFRGITLRELLAHNSGIRGCSIDYEGLKACAAAGVKAADKFPALPIWTKYSNANYSLMRLMIDQLGDNSIPPTPTQQGGRYTMLVNANTLGPAGVGNEACSPLGTPPRAQLHLCLRRQYLEQHRTAELQLDEGAAGPALGYHDRYLRVTGVEPVVAPAGNLYQRADVHQQDPAPNDGRDDAR